MIPVIIEITKYNESSNTCVAKLRDGSIINFDPFVGCAIPLTDDEYREGKAHALVGNSYLLIRYSVERNGVYPHEGGIMQIK